MEIAGERVETNRRFRAIHLLVLLCLLWGLTLLREQLGVYGIGHALIFLFGNAAIFLGALYLGIRDIFVKSGSKFARAIDFLAVGAVGFVTALLLLSFIFEPNYEL